ncbi:MAG: hypothetical protein JJT85_00965 [Chromatiales bacterium]|nr:hypothetical protein [Chromatiales bacterium]
MAASLAIGGCFGQGDGPERIPGTPAPPPPDIPPGFCDVINFEDVCGPVTFINFEGGVSQVVVNPFPGGINTTDRVARMLKFPSQFTFGGSTLPLPAGVDFSLGTAFTVKVWSQRQVPVLFKLEGLEVERSRTHDGGSTWRQLCFDFSGATAGPAVTGMTVIFDIDVMGNADADPGNWTFYFDEITQVEFCEDSGELVNFPIDFEGDPSSYVFRDGGGFAGGQASVISNPEPDGNDSAQVGQMLKFAGDVFGGATLDLDGPLNLAPGSAFTMDVWSRRPVPVTVKLEGGPVGEDTAFHTGSGWETLCFDFSALSGSGTDGITLIFDLGVNGAAATDPLNWTFYFDNIDRAPPCEDDGFRVVLPVDFEGVPPVFDNFEGGVSTVIDNPVPGSINTSPRVARMQKFAGEVFAGSTLPLGSPIDFSAGEVFRMLVWSQRPVDVLFKLEREGPELQRNPRHGGSGWEVMCFDFTGDTPGIQVGGITLIFDLGVVGDAASDPDNWTFYFDDIEQVESCGG